MIEMLDPAMTKGQRAFRELEAMSRYGRITETQQCQHCADVTHKNFVTVERLLVNQVWYTTAEYLVHSMVVRLSSTLLSLPCVEMCLKWIGSKTPTK